MDDGKSWIFIFILHMECSSMNIHYFHIIKTTVCLLCDWWFELTKRWIFIRVYARTTRRVLTRICHLYYYSSFNIKKKSYIMSLIFIIIAFLFTLLVQYICVELWIFVVSYACVLWRGIYLKLNIFILYLHWGYHHLVCFWCLHLQMHGRWTNKKTWANFVSWTISRWQ